MRRVFKILIFIIAFCVLFFIFLIQPPKGTSSSIRWGVVFSKPFTISLGLDWKETYLAILSDLGVKYMRLPVYWPDIEPQENNYTFDDYDWMVKEAEKRGTKLVLVIGRKVPRWPECFIPFWVKENSDLLNYLEAVVNRYKNSPALYLWQVENEPFLSYGQCPPLDVNLLEQEINLVRSLDSKHKILITDSGELSSWLSAAKQGDVFGTTMYRIVWDKSLGYISYFFIPHQFYWLKANFARIFYPQKPIIVSELQAEPWGPGLIYDLSVETQMQSMDLKQFNKNIEFAKKVGFSEVYLWGTEWWYWLKVKHNDPSFWEFAKKIF